VGIPESRVPSSDEIDFTHPSPRNGHTILDWSLLFLSFFPRCITSCPRRRISHFNRSSSRERKLSAYMHYLVKLLADFVKHKELVFRVAFVLFSFWLMVFGIGVGISEVGWSGSVIIEFYRCAFV
jgi:hypothetical protein